MQIDSQTPQVALERLYRAVTRRELLKSSPLNVWWFLRFALLFLMFPGMVLGFWVGLGLTLVFCVALICLMGMDHTPEAVLATQVWLACGGCVLVFWCGGVLYYAVALRRKRETPRPADPEQEPQPPLLPCAEEKKLRWHKEVGADGVSRWVAKLRFYAPVAGIYAFYISAPEMRRRLFLSLGQQGMCTVYSSTDGDKLQALLLYKLSAGVHTLCWTMEPHTGRYTPKTKLTLLCRP